MSQVVDKSRSGVTTVSVRLHLELEQPPRFWGIWAGLAGIVRRQDVPGYRCTSCQPPVARAGLVRLRPEGEAGQGMSPCAHGLSRVRPFAAVQLLNVTSNSLNAVGRTLDATWRGLSIACVSTRHALLGKANIVAREREKDRELSDQIFPNL